MYCVHSIWVSWGLFEFHYSLCIVFLVTAGWTFRVAFTDCEVILYFDATLPSSSLHRHSVSVLQVPLVEPCEQGCKRNRDRDFSFQPETRPRPFKSTSRDVWRPRLHPCRWDVVVSIHRVWCCWFQCALTLMIRTCNRPRICALFVR